MRTGRHGSEVSTQNGKMSRGNVGRDNVVSLNKTSLEKKVLKGNRERQQKTDHGFPKTQQGANLHNPEVRNTRNGRLSTEIRETVLLCEKTTRNAYKMLFQFRPLQRQSVPGQPTRFPLKVQFHLQKIRIHAQVRQVAKNTVLQISQQTPFLTKRGRGLTKNNRGVVSFSGSENKRNVPQEEYGNKKWCVSV